MTEKELFASFERIHPSYRELTLNAKGGKAANWRTLNTKPEEGSGLISIPLVHLELGHGSADALAHFFLAAMAFVRERYKEKANADGD
mgnify:CR=1 FL=1